MVLPSSSAFCWSPTISWSLLQVEEKKEAVEEEKVVERGRGDDGGGGRRGEEHGYDNRWIQ